MPRYTARFRTDAGFAEQEFEAETAQQALAFARALYADAPDCFRFEAYDGAQPVNEIAVLNVKGHEIAVWQDANLRVRLAACELLDAAELVIDRWQRTDLAEAVRELNDAVTLAKGERPQALLLRRASCAGCGASGGG